MKNIIYVLRRLKYGIETLKDFVTLTKDTTGMAETQLQYHNHLCEIIKKNIG